MPHGILVQANPHNDDKLHDHPSPGRRKGAFPSLSILWPDLHKHCQSYPHNNQPSYSNSRQPNHPKTPQCVPDHNLINLCNPCSYTPPSHASNPHTPPIPLFIYYTTHCTLPSSQPFHPNRNSPPKITIPSPSSTLSSCTSPAHRPCYLSLNSFPYCQLQDCSLSTITPTLGFQFSSNSPPVSVSST